MSVTIHCAQCAHFCGFEHCKNGICDKDPHNKKAVYPTGSCEDAERKLVTDDEV